MSNRRVSVVTGGASGIGAAIVAALTEEGDKCVVLDLARPQVPLAGVDYLSVDLGAPDSIAVVEQRLAEIGVTHVDCLVHCAAVLMAGPFRSTARSDWERVLRVNLDGTIAVSQAVAPLMARGGRIVFFSSGTVFKGPRNLFAYVASKAGVVGFARCLAEELGEAEITVNVVSPGLTNTPMMAPLAANEADNIANRALRRRQEPSDLVGPVMFLLSPAAAFVTGQTLCVDGGAVKH